ncbi:MULTISPECIES: penicillin-binding protein activator LpoB [Lonsdalea]|uniref:Penicillin-binding protein activator LpoB n=2 Tax=Lonsdalea TaxID=1082702 RepID=A0ACD1JCX7_9GAMM|nr:MULTISPECIES: penicillin-binding protein activator LpoB [Lonsdalea]OSM99451.1 penicillin-binding protein activator LpoB [Lonsdalea populi]RAT13856.1 penicillin-binding protein activator LpoB [Lonsdalea quercina]RAT20137.1 penicillin-binding protein activator LpoB [Lonsdalea populi]RAT21007.1 penicillin-binding protein activator LpoB [Lonsdalea populi]RAT27939.1 penicillin-binding protein activator LpoB [Lonsdalea populi]
MKKYLGVLLLALIAAGCTSRQQQPEQPPAPVQTAEPTAPSQPLPPQSEPVPSPPKLQSLDWQASVSPLVDQMLKTEGIINGSLLLLDNVKNSTNGSLQTGKATTALYNALGSNPVFTLVSRQQLGVARQALGLSAEDSLGSRSKAIGLARYVGAQYVLYSDASGDVKSPELELQLMLVQTGEIVWSGSGVIHE